MSIDSSFLEKLIVKGALESKQFLVLLSNAFEHNFFDDLSAGEIYKFTKTHLEEFKSLPPKEIIVNSMGEEMKNSVLEILQEVESIDFDISQNFDYLVKESNEYLKQQAVKRAIVKSVDLVGDNGNREKIREEIENALCKDIRVELGLNYFNELGPRLKRIFSTTDIRIPTYYPQFDEYINGGFPPFTLSVMVAKIHGFKSNTMMNFAARQALHGHNVVGLTLEMSEDMYAQRFDSIYSLMDINRMYSGSENQSELIRKLKEVKEREDRGNLIIKQFPTGEASIRDFRVFIRELLIRDINPSIIYVDYINLMKSSLKKESSDLYSNVKRIAEELRALSFEFEVPIISVSQLNREGGFIGLEDISFNYIAESLGLPATADFMAILGTDDDLLVYQNELHYKITKNRLGGRVGEVDKLYYDQRNLKMYDSTELDLWMSEATGNREFAQRREVQENDNRRRRR